jgi:hypothetical protein
MQNKNSQEEKCEGRGEIRTNSRNGGEMLPIDALSAQN